MDAMGTRARRRIARRGTIAAVWISACVVGVTLAAAPQTAEQLTVLRRVWTVGVEAGPPEQEFGRIVDAARDSSGLVYLLDAGEQAIRVFSADGRFLRAVSREGRGPGELVNPLAIRHDGVSTLYVLDAVNGLSLWRTSAGATTYLRTILLQSTRRAADFCLLGTRIFVYATASDLKLVREIGPDGRELRAFGEMYGPAEYPPAARMTLSADGRLACSDSRGLVLAVARDVGEVRAYRAADGGLAWRDSASGFSPWALSVLPSGAGIQRRVAFGAPNHSAQVLRLLDDDVALMQARRVHANERIDSWFIDVRTGREVARSDRLMRLPVPSRTRGVLLQEIPHSTVSLVELRYAGR
jgi:hypothetical protein